MRLYKQVVTYHFAVMIDWAVDGETPRGFPETF